MFESKKEVKVIFVTAFNPTSQGHGGNHRSYQIYFDLFASFGGKNISVISYEQWLQGEVNAPTSLPNNFKNRLKRNKFFRRWITYFQNPLKLLWNNPSFSPYRFTYPDFLNLYESEISTTKQPIICLIDHPGFFKIIQINKKRNIPTICISHNLEAFDTAPSILKTSDLSNLSIFKDLFDEVTVLKNCNRIFTISKVEAGFLGGLGLSVDLYPYIPVGEIKKRLTEIRQMRSSGKYDKNLFLLIGSASHLTTGEGMLWFLNYWENSPLNREGSLVVVGRGTEAFRRMSSSGLEFKGFVDQEELDNLIIQAKAIVIPQFRGFGALTRIPELICAGVPVISSQHPGFAIDLPNGVALAKNEWSDWEGKLSEYSQRFPDTVSAEDYENWERKQHFPLSEYITRELCMNYIRTKNE